jgi:hypothetical protein
LHQFMSTIQLLIPNSNPFDLIRIGGSGDGSYLIPDDLEGIDACFSPGVNNFKNFEDQLTNHYGIKCHMCDFSSNPRKFKTPLVKGMQTFKKKWLDVDGGNDSISLKEWVEELSPDANNDLILQIDIEGAEYRNLLATDSNTLNRFRIIVIELHDLFTFKIPELFSKKVGPLLAKLNETHVSIHAHPNNCGGDSIEPVTGLNIPNVIEVTYLRRDRFTGNESQYIHPQLPHPLDISWNVRKNPPIHLNENWLIPNKRNIESQMKVLSDNLDFANWERDELKTFAATTLDELANLQRLSNVNLYTRIQGKAEDSTALGEKYFDLANGKKYFVSKSHASYPTEGIVKEDSKFFFHTASSRNQSITINLEQSRKLQYLVVGNRGDMCQDRAKTLFCIIHDTEKFSINDALPMVVTDEFLRPGGGKSITPLFGKEGRYLTIFSPIHTALHFASICIY